MEVTSIQLCPAASYYTLAHLGRRSPPDDKDQKVNSISDVSGESFLGFLHSRETQICIIHSVRANDIVEFILCTLRPAASHPRWSLWNTKVWENVRLFPLAFSMVHIHNPQRCHRCIVLSLCVCPSLLLTRRPHPHPTCTHT